MPLCCAAAMKSSLRCFGVSCRTESINLFLDDLLQKRAHPNRSFGHERFQIRLRFRIQPFLQSRDVTGNVRVIPQMPNRLNHETRLRRPAPNKLRGATRRNNSVNFPNDTRRGTPSVWMTILAGT